MKTIHQVHPQDFAGYTTKQVREKFLLENLVVADRIECVYTHYDRMIIGAAHPVNQALELGTYEQLKADIFLSRREIGIVSIAGNGSVTVDGCISGEILWMHLVNGLHAAGFLLYGIFFRVDKCIGL